MRSCLSWSAFLLMFIVFKLIHIYVYCVYCCCCSCYCLCLLFLLFLFWSASDDARHWIAVSTLRFSYVDFTHVFDTYLARGVKFNCCLLKFNI